MSAINTLISGASSIYFLLLPQSPRTRSLWAVNWPRSLPGQKKKKERHGGAREIHHLSVRIDDLIYHTQQSHLKITSFFFNSRLDGRRYSKTHDGHLTFYFLLLKIYYRESATRGVLLFFFIDWTPLSPPRIMRVHSPPLICISRLRHGFKTIDLYSATGLHMQFRPAGREDVKGS